MGIDGDIILKAGLDIDGIKTGLGNLTKTIKKGLKNAIRIGFGVRSIYALIRKLRTALISGFQDLAQVHEPFNQAMSEIMTSLRLLRNSFASAFAPIIETVAPALSKFITLVAEAVSQVGQFIAALTGKEYVKAGTVVIDYADSTDKSAKSTKDATDSTKKQNKALKELKKTLLGFDDVEILHEDKDDADSSTPSASTTPSSIFSTVPVSKAISDFVKDFKAAWENADFTDIGRKIGTKLKNALDSIDWDGIKDTLRRIASSIATFLNGFLSVPGLFDSIGKTIAEVINSAFTFVETFVTKFDWATLGRAIRDLIIGVLTNLDWETIRNAMTGIATGIGTTIQTLFTSDKLWTAIYNGASEFANTFASYLNSLFNEDTFAVLGATVGRLITAVFTFLDTFGTTFDFDNFGESVAAGLTNILTNLDWETINQAMGSIADGIGRVIQSVFNSDNLWNSVFSTADQFAVTLANFLNDLFTEDTFTTLGETVANLLNLAFDFLNHFDQEFDYIGFSVSFAAGINKTISDLHPERWASTFNSFVNHIRDAVVEFMSKVDWIEFGNTVKFLIQGIDWEGILRSIGVIFWIAINSAIDFFKGLFRGEERFAPVTEALEKLQDDMVAIKDNVDLQALADGLDKIVTALKPVGEGFAKGLIDFFDYIVTHLVTPILALLSLAISAFGDAIEKLDPATLSAVGVALGIVAGAFVLYKGLTTVGKILGSLKSSTSGFFKELVKHPMLAIAVGLVAVAAGLKELIDVGFFSDADTKIAIQNANAVLGAAKEARQEAEALVENATKEFSETNAKYSLLSSLADEYFNLAENAAKSNSEMNRMNQIKEILERELPGFAELMAENATKPYEDQRQAVQDLITSTQAYYLTLAAEEYLKSYYEDLFALQVQEEALKQANADLTEAYQGFGDTNTLIGGILRNVTDIFDGTNNKIIQNNAEINNLQAEQEALGYTLGAIQTTLAQFGLTVDETTGQVISLSDASVDTQTNVEGVGQSADITSGQVSGLGDSVSDVVEASKNADLDDLSASIDTVGESSDAAKEDTSGLHDTLTTFDSLEWTTALKMALISGAIKAMGESGILSDEQVAAMTQTLEGINPNNPEEAMSKIETALSNAGVTSEEFATAMITAMQNADDATKQEMTKAGAFLGRFAPTMKSKGKDIGDNIVGGLDEGLQNGKDTVATTSGDIISDDVLGTMETEGDMHSPSKKTQALGEYLVQGLINGLNDLSRDVSSTAKSIIESVINAMSEYKNTFFSMGQSFMSDLQYGISWSYWNVIGTANDISYSIADAFNGQDWWSIGDNIAVGLRNGLANNASWLAVEAWNIAVDMYNSACAALGIGSPSKKFAWIGEMTMLGLEKGIANNSDNVIDSIDEVIDTTIDHADKDIDLSVKMDTSINSWVDSLDSVLTDFSDTVIDKFDSLIVALNNTLTLTNYQLPAITEGMVIPSSITNQQASSDNMASMISMLEDISSDRLTRDDLASILTSVVREYMNISFYLGDEQIARHANSGNLKLNRRYSTITS